MGGEFHEWPSTSHLIQHGFSHVDDFGNPVTERKEADSGFTRMQGTGLKRASVKIAFTFKKGK